MADRLRKSPVFIQKGSGGTTVTVDILNPKYSSACIVKKLDDKHQFIHEGQKYKVIMPKRLKTIPGPLKWKSGVTKIVKIK